MANIIYIAGFDESSDQPAVWTVQPIGNGNPLFIRDVNALLDGADEVGGSDGFEGEARR